MNHTTSIFDRIACAARHRMIESGGFSHQNKCGQDLSLCNHEQMCFACSVEEATRCLNSIERDLRDEYGYVQSLVKELVMLCLDRAKVDEEVQRLKILESVHALLLTE